MILFRNISSLVTVKSGNKGYKEGKEMQDIEEIKDAAIIFDEKIVWIGRDSEAEKCIADNEYIINETRNLKGKTIMPGFVDSHTHIVFGGDRSEEFGLRMRGATYEEIAIAGGGIQNTVKATRDASFEDLYDKGKELIRNAIRYGTTSLEIKSGYSLNLEGELKQLRVIKKLNEDLPLDITSTFMGAHDFPPEFKHDRDEYLAQIINDMLPKVKEESLAEFCDIFIDRGYYTNEDAEKILGAAKAMGFRLKAHCDELADVGATKFASEMGATSVDHLLFVNDEGIESIIKNKTVASLLPGTAFFIRLPYAPARKLIDSGAIVALATDCNPGSCFTENMQLIQSLGLLNMNMTAEEVISASTINAAYSIRKSGNIGSLEIGKNANFNVFNSDNYLNIFYHFGINQIEETRINGKLINIEAL